MSSSKLRTKGKRVLPVIPGREIRKGVTFNAETVETSIGGTQTPGKVKGDPLSPVNQLSYDESSLRTGFSDYVDMETSVDDSLSLQNDSASSTMNCMSPLRKLVTLENNKGNVSVEVELTNGRDSNSESDKENDPGLKTVSVSVERTPVKANNVNFLNVYSVEKDVDSLRIYSPSPNMKNRQYGTPIRRHTMDEKILGTPECYNVVQLDKPRYDFGFHDNINGDEEDSSVTVAVRVRPYSQRELADPSVRRVVSISGNETTVKTDSGAVHSFVYDFSFSSFDRNNPEYASQEQVYCVLGQPLLGKAFEGYNTCLFAYGQTGSGKSYSIMGHGEDTGIIPRFCEELFSRAEVAKDMHKVKFHVEISFFEIYNEKIHDLLASSTKGKGMKKTTLRVREHPTLGPYVEGLSTFVVNSFDDVEGWITLGNKNRATAATGMNDKSSRSHSVFTIVLTQTKSEVLEGQEHDHVITSKINLVDLAGSERQSQAQTSGERLREGANINKSLLTLGKVISQLAEQAQRVNKRKKIFIPYRDSVLTWLLKESLGGNSKTAMIATVSPSNHHTDETLSTLRYAQTARSIVNIARVNEDPKAKLIRELRAEIEKLRTSGLVGTEDVTAECLVEINTLREKLLSKEQEMEEITKSWQERLRESEERKQEEAKLLEKAGVTLKVDNRLPNLVNLNEDPQLSEMLLYNIKEGTTNVGRMGSSTKHDIQLNGALIADNHCIITNIDSVISITPLGDAPTYVNGNMISETWVLRHADRVILGGDHYFRFNHPMEVERCRKDKTVASGGAPEIKDFQFAQAELMMVQEARLQEARQEAQEEMLVEIEKTKKDAEIKLADLEKVFKEESAEKEKKAEGVIHQLKRQKMLLEQEVLAGRKRQQFETEAAQKASEQLTLKRSRMLELLESQREKERQMLNDLKQRRSECTKKCVRSPASMMVVASTGKMDLYRVALQVREANKISQYMNRHTRFEREDFLDGDSEQTVIKVTNTKLNMSTHWSLDKFEEKLMQMRDIYQNEADSSADDDDVFNDPKDQWEKNETSSPRSARDSSKPSLPSPSLRQALLSSSSTRTDGSMLEKGFPYTQVGGPGGSSVCKDVVNLMLSQFSSCSLEDSVADKILHNCHTLKMCLSQATDLSLTMETNNNSITNLTNVSTSGSLTSDPRGALMPTCIQITASFQTLLTTTSLWSSLFQNFESALVQDLLSKLVEQVKVMGGQIVRFFQGCEGDIDNLVQESISRLHEGLHTVCKLTGELALATDTHMLYFENIASSHTETTGKVNMDVCQAFFSGCETFIDKTLQGALRTVDDFESKAQSLSDLTTQNLGSNGLPQMVEVCISSCSDLLRKCQALQVEVDGSMTERSYFTPLQFCHGNYRRSQALVSHVSSLVNALELLVQHSEPVCDGRDSDGRKVIKCGEMIRRSSEKLTNVCGREMKRLRSSARTEEGGNPGTLSDTDILHLEYAAQEVVTSVEQMQKALAVEIDIPIATTPRGKRVLPAHPGSSPLSRSPEKSPKGGV